MRKINKKILVLTTLIFFGLVTWVVANVQQPRDGTTGYQPSIMASNDTEPEIARSLFDKYLKYYESSEVPEYQRLKDYKINEIMIREKTNDGFVYSANFSVQGFNANTTWIAGNGDEKNGWIENKLLFITVKQHDKTFTIAGMGTSG